ncbi:MAG TPA: recombinase [Micromonosporaceae bacterium]|nr:recombinase [Micromonosporaceae bacterium]HCU48585.1 recombinase [Micromonosporaceae bacterium]
MSTADHQDRRTSRWWQYRFAEELVSPHGRIVTEFFDSGVSRRRSWLDRPEAAALLAALADPDRGFDAVVIGEFERAFHRNQVTAVLKVFAYHGVQLWLPEADGPLDMRNRHHVALIHALSTRSGREVSRASIRTTAAMEAQVELEGRNIGGRPPYGYQFVTAGPHPNRAQARWGRMLHALEPDPRTAPWVQWIFARRLAGWTMAGIARELNDRGVPCPSRADRERNPHRSGEAWQLGTVRAILLNPRYTGRQVWGRQRTDRDTAASFDHITSGSETGRWNQPPEWTISIQAAHPPLVSEDDFVNVQPGTKTYPAHNAQPADNLNHTDNAHVYALVGIAFCAICGRRMDPHWARVRPAYRCRHGHRSTRSKPAESAVPNLYIREDHLLTSLRHATRQHPQLAGPRDTSPAAQAIQLRQQHMIIVCDSDTWTLETPDGAITLLPAPGLPTAAIPAERQRRSQTPA